MDVWIGQDMIYQGRQSSAGCLRSGNNHDHGLIGQALNIFLLLGESIQRLGEEIDIARVSLQFASFALVIYFDLQASCDTPLAYASV